jgi:FMN phosphatase YigB (HAD superfamily)
MKTKNIKLVIFDVYGVLLYGGYPDTCKLLAEKYNRDWKELYNVIYKFYFNKAAMREISQKEAWQKSIKDLQIPISVEDIKKIHYGLISYNKNIFNFINKIKNNYKILLLSKNTREQFSYMVSHIPIIKKTFGKNMINTWEYNLPKASEETVSLVCKRFKIRPEEIVYIDDQEENLERAKAMGVKTILYKNFDQFEKAIKIVLG